MRTCISIALAVALWFGINERYAGAVSYWDQPQNTTDGAGTEFCSPGVLSANCVMESESDGSVACVPSVVAHTILGFDGMTLVWITSPAGQSYGGSGIAGFVTNDYGQIISATAETFVTPTTTIGFGGDVIGSGPVVGPVNLVLSPKGAIAGQVMTFDGSFWNPATPISGSVTAVTGSGGVSVASPSPTPNVTLANFDCSSGDFVSSANTVSGLACTTPFYQTWIDASLTPLPQEPFSEAGVGLDISDDSGNSATKIALPAVGTAGSCTNCSVTFDGFGRETARSSGTAPVTSVTGNDGLTCSPSAPNPTCSGVGVYVSGTATPSSVDLGALASGVNEQTVSAGVATPVVFASGSTRIPFGSGANGQFTDSANLTYSSGTETITGTSPLVVGNGATGTKTAVRDPDNVASFAQIDFYPASGTNVGQAYSVIPRGTGFSSTNKSQFNVFNTDAIADPVNTEWFGGRSIGTAGFVFASGHAGTGSARPIMFASDWFATGTTNANQLLLNTDGTVTLESLGAGGIVKAKASSSPAGQLAIAAPGTDYQAPLTACTDYVSVSCQGGTSDIAVGSTNAAVFIDALHDGALARWQTRGAWANGFFLGLSGGFIRALALSGDTHTVAATPGLTVTDHLTDGGGTSFSTSGAFVAGQPLIATAGNHIATNSPTGFFSKLVYSLQLQLSNNVPNTWLLSGGPGLFANSALIEYPNDFQAGHIQIIWYLRSNVVTAGSLVFSASLNGANIPGTTNTVTSATSATVHVGSVTATGSASSSDTYGIYFSTDSSFASTSPTSVFLTIEVLLTP